MKQIISLISFICLIIAIIMIITGNNHNNIAVFIGLLGLSIYGLVTLLKNDNKNKS